MTPPLKESHNNWIRFRGSLQRHYLNNAPAGTWITTFIGSFAWTRPGETGDTCTYDLTRTVVPAANTRTLVGMSCGNPIDRMDDWR